MKKLFKGMSLYFFSFAMICNSVQATPGNVWGDVNSIFEKFSELGGELDKSLSFFSDRSVKFNTLSDKMDDLATIRDSVARCVTSSYNTLVTQISDCLKNYNDQQVYYSGEISTLENDIKTLKELTDAEIAQLKLDIADYQEKYDILLIQYNTLKGMSKEAVDAALAKLLAAQAKFTTVRLEREKFSLALDVFLNKIYTQEGLSHLDIQALKALICK